MLFPNLTYLNEKQHLRVVKAGAALAAFFHGFKILSFIQFIIVLGIAYFGGFSEFFAKPELSAGILFSSTVLVLLFSYSLFFFLISVGLLRNKLWAVKPALILSCIEVLAAINIFLHSLSKPFFLIVVNIINIFLILCWSASVYAVSKKIHRAEKGAQRKQSRVKKR